MQFLYILLKTLFYVRTLSTQQRKNELCITFFKEHTAVFCFKKTPKVSKNFNIVFVQLVYFLSIFGHFFWLKEPTENDAV